MMFENMCLRLINEYRQKNKNIKANILKAFP